MLQSQPIIVAHISFNLLINYLFKDSVGREMSKGGNGHKGPVIRPRCIGPVGARTQIPLRGEMVAKNYGQKTDPLFLMQVGVGWRAKFAKGRWIHETNRSPAFGMLLPA
jgi:hypothetical protein